MYYKILYHFRHGIKYLCFMGKVLLKFILYPLFSITIKNSSKSRELQMHLYPFLLTQLFRNGISDKVLYT